MSLKKIGGKIFDDILGIDPSGQGLVGSIRDNPIIPAALNFIPGIGPVTAGLIGAGGNLLGGAGLSGALRGGLAGYGGGKFIQGFGGAAPGTSLFGRIGAGVTNIPGLGGLSGLGNLQGLGGIGSFLGGIAPYAIGAGLGQAGLLGGGAREPQPQLPPLQDFGGAPIGLSGLEYASSIAGGIPFEEIVQPGREFSLAAPMGEAVAPQAPRQIPESPYRPLLGFTPGVVTGEMTGDIPEALRGVIDPRNIGLGPGGVFDPFRDGVRVTEDDIFGRVDFIPTEIRGPSGDIFGGPLGPEDLAGKSDSALEQKNILDLLVQGSRAPQFDPFRDGLRVTEDWDRIAGGPQIPQQPLNRLADLFGIRDKQEDDGVYVGGSRDFKEYDPLKDPLGPMGRMSDVQPRSDQEIIDLIEGRLGEYQPVIPQPDLSGFARLSDIPSFVPRTDEEIRGLISEGIAGIPTPAQFDPSELQRRLAALEGREIPQFDPSGILSRLSALEAQGEPRYRQPGTEKDILPPRSPLGKLSLFG